ncbi:TIGR03086 family metal-binding protein [Spirillospora sp. NPDC029432]|uniref:TIGR03086 family metal-binding protein n=1 Tax=Spirillospora sp. NPDC029432 TaxID=3154599 RepID=UPI0034568E28
MNAPTSRIVLDEAHQALRTAVAGVPADAWARPTPCAAWNVTQVLQHAALDQLAYTTALTGAPKGEEDPFAPSGTLPEDPREWLEEHLAGAAAAWAGVPADAESAPVPLPPFALPPALGAGACALDAAVHAWDIAVATGQASPLTPDLARALLPAARAVVTEPLREYGMYAPAIVPPPGADETTELLNFLGRSPR